MRVGAPGPVAISVLGVDGGQSAIRLRHSLRDETVEVDGVSRQEGDTIAAVAHSVADGWRRGRFPETERVVMGLSTAPGAADGSERLCRLVGDLTGAREVWLADDAVTAHAGALSGCPGVSLVAGTGVACLALRASGEPRIVGGHGFLLGDEGGGFWIGRRGLAAVLRAADGRDPETSLTAAATRRYGGLVDLHLRLHDAPRPVHEIAGFAPDVLAVAGTGDEVADGIATDAVRELLLLLRTAVGWVAAEGVPVALGGRLLEGSELRRRLETALASSDLSVAVRDPDGTPLDGALWLGLSAEPAHYGELVHVWRAEGSG